MTAAEATNGGRPPRVLMLLEHGAASHWWESSLPVLRASGVELTVATVFGRGPLHENLEQAGCGPVLTLGCRTSRDYPRGALALARLVREHGSDVIHANETIAGTICGVGGKLARRGVRIFHRHHNIIEDRRQVLFSRLASRWTDLTMAVSKSSAQHAQEIDRVSPGRIRVAYNGVRELRRVSADEVAALRRRLAIPAAAPVLLVVARLWKEKGHRTLLEALSPLTTRLPRSLHVVLVGSGPEEAPLRRQAEELGRVVVHFVGHQLDVAPWYALADLVVVPSFQESFSLSAVEAMSCRRPVVATRLGGLVEVVEDGVTGVLVNPGDAGALAAGLGELLRSPEEMERMGAAGYERFRARFTLEAMIAGWRSVYSEAMANAGLGQKAL
ncbi:MAG: glycosyltransferase family 4 protein [Gemmatimonadetes bacterium]|nr:glycosyltransferase family 4 protein [Gemmatimonadota bacterium]